MALLGKPKFEDGESSPDTEARYRRGQLTFVLVPLSEFIPVFAFLLFIGCTRRGLVLRPFITLRWQQKEDEGTRYIS